MEYATTAVTILMYHADRSVLLVELPTSGIMRGEDAMACYHDGSTRCIADHRYIIAVLSA